MASEERYISCIPRYRDMPEAIPKYIKRVFQVRTDILTRFRILALDRNDGNAKGAIRKELEAAMVAHIAEMEFRARKTEIGVSEID